MADFPENELDALAYLYMQKADTSALTPAQFIAKYKEIRADINDAYRNGYGHKF